MVKRLFVEKRSGFQVEAQHLKSDICDSLMLPESMDLRLINRYDIEGLDDASLALSKTTIFSESVDEVYEDTLPLSGYEYIITEYLPGQYDQRADSAAQCVALISGEQPAVRTAKVLAIKGVGADDIKRIADYVVNPVESRLASADIPKTLSLAYDVPSKTERIIGFIKMNDDEIAAYHKELGFAMTAADLAFCRDYFIKEGRDPSITELKVIDTYWSDHCRHTTFLTMLDKIEVERGTLSEQIEVSLREYLSARETVYGERISLKPVCLMDIATMGGKLLHKQGMVPDLDVSDEINACSINATIHVDGEPQEWLIQFKNETHNHPTEIEPFGGAATCLGGAIRDPLSGRAYVYGAMRVTGSGDPTVPANKTLAGKLSQKKITTGAAAGYSSYGNQIGLATGQVAEIYDEGYVAKRMEIGAVIGASPKKNVLRGVPSDGDVIVLLGGRTGRDGCGGATGSSKAHTTDSTTTCGAEVQKGNSPTERKIQRLLRNEKAASMIKRCNDFGAGGVCVAIGELAPGLTVNLDKVPKKYEGLTGTELAISESQERMAVVLDPSDVSDFIALAKTENLEATTVATVTKEERLVMSWQGDNIVDLSREFLDTNGVTGIMEAAITAPAGNCPTNDVPVEIAELPIGEALIKNMGRLTVCSQQGLVERFDSSNGAATVLMPYAGKYQSTPEEGLVIKVPAGGKTDDATAMTYGFYPPLSRWSPYAGAQYAVVESLAKLAALGADPFAARLTFQEYFERLYENKARWGKPAAALLGAFSAQTALGTPSIGGKDSMSGSFNELDVPPTLVSFAVSLTGASDTGTAALQKSGTTLVLIKLPTKNDLPDFDGIKTVFSKVYGLVKSKDILSCSVVKDGGAAAAVIKMALGNRIGVDFHAFNRETLFAPLIGSFVAEVEDTAMLADINFIKLGTTNSSKNVTIDGETVSLEKLYSSYTKTLERVFPTENDSKVVMMPEVPLYKNRSTCTPVIKIAKPRVFIPVFPGTNCEYDSARAFGRAGGDADIFVVKNLTAADISDTIGEMTRRIEKAQMIMIPGGFSSGDEPDGSGKFIATTFRNERIKAAVMDLLYKRDGLMLGICNGFQALIKLGLVPFGEIKVQDKNDPTLTFNTLGRHVSRMVHTRVTSVLSPWLSLVNEGDIHAMPVSHGEGRFVADAETIETLIANGQIATQYVDGDGNPTGEIPWNPNGSICAIEGITSRDGRILGKMGHSERMDDNCYKNVPGNKDIKIFESGVRYFK